LWISVDVGFKVSISTLILFKDGDPFHAFSKPVLDTGGAKQRGYYADRKQGESAWRPGMVVRYKNKVGATDTVADYKEFYR
jgi:hypothetical protein